MYTKQWITRNINAPIAIKCNFHTRIIVEGHKTPTGQIYDFEPGEVEANVPYDDAEYLLSLYYKQSDCCGGSSPPAIPYFIMI